MVIHIVNVIGQIFYSHNVAVYFSLKRYKLLKIEANQLKINIYSVCPSGHF